MEYVSGAMNLAHDDVEALRGVDLNLLVAFDAVARAGNVTAAARVVGVTQSAMSHALRRLRGLFDDPLFVRSPGGVSLTPRAEDLLVPVRNGLVTLARALHEPAVFDPATTSRTFVMSTVDLVTWVAAPQMLRVLAADAPAAGLTMRPLGADFAHGLSLFIPRGQLELPAITTLLDAQLRDAAPSRVPWMKLLARVFRIDICVCSRCSGPMRVTRAVTTAQDIAAELRGARPPPRAAPLGQLLLFSAPPAAH